MERDFSCCYYNYYGLVAILQKNKAAANSLSKEDAHYFFW